MGVSVKLIPVLASISFQTFPISERKIFVFVDSNGVSNINVALVQRNYLIGKRVEEGILTSRSEGYGKEIIKNLPAFF